VGIDNTLSSYALIFLSHWGHLAIILVWVSTSLFHIGWNGNYELWEQNPIKTIPIAHGICDPHFGLSNIRKKIAYNGIYNWLYSLGFNSVFKHLYNFVITHELLAVISIPNGSSIHLIYLDGLLHKLPASTSMVKQGRYPFYTGNWVLYIHKMDKDNHIWRGTYGAKRSSNSILTFFGGLKSNTISLYLEDIAHHHLGLGILFVVSTHLYLGYHNSEWLS